MRCLIKSLPQVGLVFTLLTGGVLGGLLAPVPSDAAPPSVSPTVTLKLDAGTTLTLSALSLRDCLAADISPGGYNYCYTVPTGGIVTGTNNKQYRIDPNGTPRVRIADKNGQDKMSLTGVQFVPVAPLWSNTESHTLTLTLSATLDATTDGATSTTTINATNAGLYKWAVRSSGEFIANTGSDAVGNTLTLSGVGTFSTAKTNRPILSTENALARRGTKNLTTLSFNIQGPAATADLNWGGLTNTDMGQQDLYFPEFDCRLDYGTTQVPAACRPTITQTLTATIIGPDTLRVLGGPLDAFGVKCTETFSAQQTKQITFLKGAVKILKTVVPSIKNLALQAKLQNLITQLDKILLSINTSSTDTVCPGSAVLAFNLGVEAAGDALTLLSRPSTPAIPAPLHHYAVVSIPGLTWEGARAAAQALSVEGNVCDLATITSATEQAIINGLLPSPSGFPADPPQDYWIGGKQQVEASEPDGHWQWINEEGEFWNNGPIVDQYANWGSGEPNDCCSDEYSGEENHLTVDHRFGWGWNDLNTGGATGFPKGYITEGTSALCVPPIIN